MSGRMLSERIGKWTFWLMTIGFNLTFVIQHVLGLSGMPRRVFTYPDLPGWGWMNMLSTVGAFFMAAASILFVWNLVTSLVRGKPAGDNPWNAWTLEWAATSPPPHENFDSLPPIRSRRPLWDFANPDRPDAVVSLGGALDSFRPEKNKTGVITFVISEAGFFGVLILAYLFYNATSRSGPGARELDVLKTTLFSICLFASSFTIWRSEVGLRANKPSKMKAWLAATILLGGIFMVGQGLEYWYLFQSGVSVGLDLFATTFFTLTGFHGLHVCVGLLALLIVLGLAFAGDFRNGHSPALGAVGLYWHFVDVVWVFVFSIVYLWPLFR
jgi:heme/copper-type cytochrome/quinol oxidase subunit 3